MLIQADGAGCERADSGLHAVRKFWGSYQQLSYLSQLFGIDRLQCSYFRGVFRCKNGNSCLRVENENKICM